MSAHREGGAALSPHEQARVFNHVVPCFDFNAADGTIAVAFHAAEIGAPAERALEGAEEAA